jgi:hypothetical protein
MAGTLGRETATFLACFSEGLRSGVHTGLGSIIVTRIGTEENFGDADRQSGDPEKSESACEQRNDQKTTA